MCFIDLCALWVRVEEGRPLTSWMTLGRSLKDPIWSQEMFVEYEWRDCLISILWNFSIFKKHSGKLWNHYLHSDIQPKPGIFGSLSFGILTWPLLEKEKWIFYFIVIIDTDFLPITERESQNRNKKIGTVEAYSFQFSLSLRLGRPWVLIESEERIGLRE